MADSYAEFWIWIPFKSDVILILLCWHVNVMQVNILEADRRSDVDLDVDN